MMQLRGLVKILTVSWKWQVKLSSLEENRRGIFSCMLERVQTLNWGPSPLKLHSTLIESLSLSETQRPVENLLHNRYTSTRHFLFLWSLKWLYMNISIKLAFVFIWCSQFPTTWVNTWTLFLLFQFYTVLAWLHQFKALCMVKFSR